MCSPGKSHCRSILGKGPARLSGPKKQESQALRMDRKCRSDPGQGSRDFVNAFLTQDTSLSPCGADICAPKPCHWPGGGVKAMDLMWTLCLGPEWTAGERSSSSN